MYVDPTERWRPAYDSIWRCPCGVQARYAALCGHRKGYKKRPECKGRITMVSAPGGSDGNLANAPEHGSVHPVGLGALPGPEEPYGDPVGQDPELGGVPHEPMDEIPVDDAESIARQFNERKRHLLEPGFIHADHLTAGVIEEYASPDGDFYTEKPEEASDASTAREVVSLPVIVRVFYDWARGRGWHQGDGSLGSFVTDCLLDHFNNCWGVAVVVVRRDEVAIDDGGTNQQGLLVTSNGRKS
ncbi:MAG: hypothetical protein Q8R28_14415 [Dehalococcoidia bacterium]|nr:hypothetical protein [Dehalococcoidia bacterium]